MRSVGLTKGLTGGLRALKAGEVSEFTEVVDHAWRTAMERLVGHAQQLGGNAVLGVRFDSSDIGTAWLRSSPTARPRWCGQPERALRPYPADDHPVGKALPSPGLCRVNAHSSSFVPQVMRCGRPLTSTFVAPCWTSLSPRLR